MTCCCEDCESCGACMYVCMCAYTYIHTDIFSLHIYVHAHIHTYILTYFSLQAVDMFKEGLVTKDQAIGMVEAGMYVCMYVMVLSPRIRPSAWSKPVCMYVCMYVCNVCMYVWNICMYAIYDHVAVDTHVYM